MSSRPATVLERSQAASELLEFTLEVTPITSVTAGVAPLGVPPCDKCQQCAKCDGGPCTRSTALAPIPSPILSNCDDGGGDKVPPPAQ